MGGFDAGNAQGQLFNLEGVDLDPTDVDDPGGSAPEKDSVIYLLDQVAGRDPIFLSFRSSGRVGIAQHAF